MLIQFSFKNFKAFKEEVLLDFLPASINEHKNTLLKDPADGERILLSESMAPTAAVSPRSSMLYPVSPLWSQHL